MSDTTTETNLTQVVSSYGDVNTALEKLLANLPANYASLNDLTNLQNTVNNAGYATEKELNNLADSVPVGTIFAYSSNTVPTGYMLCNGASFDKTQLSDLFNALGTNTVPDTRGLFLRGLDTTGSVDNYGGTRALLSFEEGSYLIKDPNNEVAAFYRNGDTTSAGLQLTNWDQRASNSGSIPYAWAYNSNIGYVGTGGLASYDNSIGIARPKNIAVNYIIKAFKLATYGTASNALTTNGGTLTGQLVGNKGGVVPQILNVGGNVVMQAFSVQAKDNDVITFPTPFASTPLTVQLTTEHAIGSSTNVVDLRPGTLTNTGFSLAFSWFTGTGTNAQTDDYTVYVLAIGLV